MATAGNNLSHYSTEDLPNVFSYKIGIVTSEWNNDITFAMRDGAIETLINHGVSEKNIIQKLAPGTYELALAAQWLFEYSDVDAVVCIGNVIQGETRHFDFVCEAAAQGIKDVSLKYNKAAIFCVLTDNNKQQSIDRSGGKHGNKGVEAAVAALKMVALQKSLQR